jgi:hypothetical protein
MITEYIFDFPNWFFQREIPTVWSEFNTKIPEFYKFLSVTRGYHEYSIKEEIPYNEQITLRPSSGPRTQAGERNMGRNLNRELRLTI